jgi:hypothetical protein
VDSSRREDAMSETSSVSSDSFGRAVTSSVMAS